MDDLSAELLQCGRISNGQGIRVIIHCIAISEIETFLSLKLHSSVAFNVKLSVIPWFSNCIALRCDFLKNPLYKKVIN